MADLVTNVAASTTITSAWGNSVANAINDTLIRRDGTITMTGDLTLRNANPTNANHAARKKYVDDMVADRMSASGGTVAGQLNVNAQATSEVLTLRSQVTGGGGALVNTPMLSFYNHTLATRFAYIQATAANLNIVSTNGDVLINSGGGQVRCGDAIYAAGARFYTASGASLHVLGASEQAIIGLYSQATSTDSIGSRSGYLGFNNTSNLTLSNERNGSSIFVRTDYATAFVQGGSEIARIIPAVMMVGKTDATLTTIGISLYENGSVQASRASGIASAPLIANRQSGVDGDYLLQLTRNAVTIGRIEMEGTTGVKLVSGSDRRMKNIVGPITDGVERVKAMQPYRVTWQGDAARGTTDAFIADEMMDIVPEAVSGLPDAVAGPPVDEDDPPEGTPIMQGMSYEKLVTVTIAALQDVIARVEALEAA